MLGGRHDTHDTKIQRRDILAIQKREKLTCGRCAHN